MQNQSRKIVPLDMEKWREIIETWSKSGENQKSYCERLGLNLNSFSYARGKLSQETILKRIGVDIPRTTLSLWVIKCAEQR